MITLQNFPTPIYPKAQTRRREASRRPVRCQNGRNIEESSQSENVILKAAWYGSEALGIAASVFRPVSEISPRKEKSLLGEEESGGSCSRELLVEAIKDDFKRSYFVTGDLTLEAYEEDCEFADPAGSFKGLGRFKRNCSNFGSLLVKSNMKLMKWEDFEDKGIGHWRFSCVMIFPWRPILSATGYTEYYFSADSGRVCRHVEHWNVPKMALFKQIFRPTKWVWFDEKTSRHVQL